MRSVHLARAGLLVRETSTQGEGPRLPGGLGQSSSHSHDQGMRTVRIPAGADGSRLPCSTLITHDLDPHRPGQNLSIGQGHFKRQIIGPSVSTPKLEGDGAG